MIRSGQQSHNDYPAKGFEYKLWIHPFSPSASLAPCTGPSSSATLSPRFMREIPKEAAVDLKQLKKSLSVPRRIPFSVYKTPALTLFPLLPLGEGLSLVSQLDECTDIGEGSGQKTIEFQDSRLRDSGYGGGGVSLRVGCKSYFVHSWDKAPVRNSLKEERLPVCLRWQEKGG